MHTLHTRRYPGQNQQPYNFSSKCEAQERGGAPLVKFRPAISNVPHRRRPWKRELRPLSTLFPRSPLSTLTTFQLSLIAAKHAEQQDLARRQGCGRNTNACALKLKLCTLNVGRIW